MENKDSEGTSDRGMVLKIGDFVISIDPEYHFGEVGEIINMYDLTFLQLKHLDFWINKRFFKRISKQEYIVAKLKGRLYV